MNPIEYVGFTDESYITASRYRSITMVSYDRSSHNAFRDDIKKILTESNVEEFKWQKLKNARYRFCAQKMIDLVFSAYHTYSIRVDTIVWDTDDSRHAVQKRDDSANYARMFFHLVSNVLSRRRNPNAVWSIFPDEKNDIDWETLNQCLANKGKKIARSSPLIEELCETAWFYSIDRFEQAPSESCVQIQMADLFSGIAVFSVNEGPGYRPWKDGKTPCLFDIDEKKFSNSEENRFQVMEHLINRAVNENLSIDFQNDKRFKTKNPNDFINFWHYVPQSRKDIAPTKNRHKNADN